MTVTTTPKLGLMSPVGTDEFKTSDFATTMAILDGSPGTLPVPNQASRPTTWNQNQHGRKVLQMDQGIEWYWYQPASSPPGEWRRIAPKGLLHVQDQSTSSISSTTKVYTSGVTVISTPSIVVPGGRKVLVTLKAGTLGNTAGFAIASFWENGSIFANQGFNGFQFASQAGTKLGQLGLAAYMGFVRDPAPTVQASVTYKITIAAFSGYTNAGTTTISGATLQVKEI